MTAVDERAYWLGFSRVPGIGVRRATGLRQAFGTLEAAWHASERDLERAKLPGFVIRNLIATRRTLDLRVEIKRLDSLGAWLLTLQDEDYPYLLRNIENPPMVLYVKGALTPDDQRALAMVGTRKATKTGRDNARAFAKRLAAQSVTIVSGMAQGIDAEAHQGALDANGRTIAVLGSGIDVIYPRQHATLARSITGQGALVTEFPPGTPPEAAHFPRRNRIISGLSQGVLIVEAPEKSGALITAAAAAEHGRDLFAIPASLSNTMGHGCNRLIQEGAKLVMDISDILTELRPAEEQTRVRARIEALAADTPVEAAILEQLHGDPVHVDDISRACGLPMPDVLAALTVLELKGLAQTVGPMQYCGTF